MFRQNFKLYNFLKNDLKLSDAKAEEFVTALAEEIQLEVEGAATKYKSLWKDDLTKLEINLEGKIKDSKIDTIKWMVGIFLALALMILGK